MSFLANISRENVVATVAFTAVSASFICACKLRNASGSSLQKRQLSNEVSPLPVRANVFDIVAKIEERVQRDEGKRGIAELILPGELQKAAIDAIRARNIVIITGFPCLVDFTPPTETDGPLGALAIARSMLALGNNKVSVLTDECNEEVMLAAAAGSGLFEKYRSRFTLESFPPSPTFDDTDEARLNKIADNCDLLIAIERTGPSKDGSYRTMRGIDMSSIVAPLDMILSRRMLSFDDEENASLVERRTFRSVGIGDGGNEVGMGKVYHVIANSQKIPNAELIGCVVPTDHLLTASVSNWGGYALSAAIVLLACCGGDDIRVFPRTELAAKLSEGLVSREVETLICERMVEAGARDGISKEQKCMVDGFPLSTSLDVLDDIRRLALSVV